VRVRVYVVRHLTNNEPCEEHGETQGKITITTNKASVLNASTINNKFAAINKRYIKAGNIVALEGWYRTYLLHKASGVSVRSFAESATKNSDWTADSIRNRVGHIEWALANIQTEGKKAVMWIDNDDKFHSVVDSMETIVTTRYPKQKTSVKNAKKDRVVSVKTMDYKEVRKRLNSVVLNGKALTSEQKDIIAFAIMQDEVK
jgi:hypothetical protein